MYYSTAETGKRIKQLRRNERLTQEELAEKVGVSPRTVRAFESGSNGTSIDVLIDLAELFNTSLDYLILGRLTQSDIKERLNIILQSFSEIVKSIK